MLRLNSSSSNHHFILTVIMISIFGIIAVTSQVGLNKQLYQNLKVLSSKTVKWNLWIVIILLLNCKDFHKKIILLFLDIKILHDAGKLHPTIYRKPIFRGVELSLKVFYQCLTNMILFLLWYILVLWFILLTELCMMKF